MCRTGNVSVRGLLFLWLQWGLCDSSGLGAGGSVRVSFIVCLGEILPWGSCGKFSRAGEWLSFLRIFDGLGLRCP